MTPTSDKSYLELVTVVGRPNTLVYRWYDSLVVRISELKLDKKDEDDLSHFMSGQTMPFVEGIEVQDFIYLHDYDNWLHKKRTGRAKFFD
jgi:hypothetical protein